MNVKVEPAVLRAHAAKVADISDGVASAKSASAATNLGGGAFGFLCSFMVPPLSAVVSVEQFLCGAAPTGSDIRLFTTVQAYEYGGRQRYPGGEAPSIAFWPALARWFRALEARSGWVGPEERSALGL